VPASALEAFLGQTAKDQSGYCRKEHKKTQKTGKAGNEPGQSQDGSTFLSSFRFLRQTLFPLVAALIEGFMGFVRHSSRPGGLAAFPTSGPNTDRQTKQSREAAKPRRGTAARRTTRREDRTWSDT
jgi:hypothetical protein